MQILVCCLATYCLAQGDAVADKKLLQGKWKAISITDAGKEETIGDKELLLIVEGGKVRFLDDEALVFTLDAQKKPKHIDWKNKNFSETGIYEIRGDELRICLHNKNRPSEFTSNRENRHLLIVLKRSKN